MNGDWQGILNTTTQEYIRQVERNILRNRRLVALAKQAGRFTFNHSGRFMDWKVEYKQNKLLPHAYGSTLTFPQRNRYDTLQLEWRGYAMTDMITRMEKEQNKGAASIINTFGEKASNLLKDMSMLFGQEFYIDGNAAANTLRFHGINSFLSGAFAGGAYPTLAPNSSYAGKSTGLGVAGGTWNGTWPDGTGDTEYDYLAPMLVNYSSSFFGGGVTGPSDWNTTCHKALRYLIIKSMRSDDMGQANIDAVLITDSMYFNWLNVLDAKERVVVQKNEARSPLVRLGFSNATNIDGTDVTFEYGVPQDEGYAFNFSGMEICSLLPQLFVPDGPTWDMDTQTFKFAVNCLGNIRCNPRKFGKLQSKTS